METWREKWRSCDVVNKDLIEDPTARVPGFDLPRPTWALLNRFRANAGPCRNSLFRWGARESPQCDCGAVQTMQHIVEECPDTRLRGGLAELHSASEAAASWLENLSL